MNLNMNTFGHFLRRAAAAGALVASFLLLFSVEGNGQCCCPVCQDGNTGTDHYIEGSPECPNGCQNDYSQCPECNTAIPLTDHLWVLAVLGAAGGAWMLMRKRTEGDLA